jgi:hypothetical protein
MNTYIGTKIINAEPSPAPRDIGEYEEGDEGYKVKYEDGYMSWSPKVVFENAYKRTNNMNFGLAIEAMKKGYKVQRKGWNGKGMWLILVTGTTGCTPLIGSPYSNAGLANEIDINPHIDMYTAQGDMQPGWLASQSDMLANDWCIVDD